MRRQPFSKAREDYIEESEEKLRELVRRFQSRLNTVSIDYLLDNLSFKDGKVSDANLNYNIISRLDKHVDKELKPLIDKLLVWIVNRIKGLSELNRKYFKKFGGTKSQKDKAQSKLLKSMGATVRDGKLSIQTGGLLDGLTDLTEPKKRIKSIARAAVVAGIISIPVLRGNVSTVVKGKNKLGIVESRFYQQAKDTFTMVDRTIGNSLAKDVGIRAAVYQGGKITTSRKFCCDRDNQVFTFDEIRSWVNLDWQGKPDVGYNPFVDCGGINCRHVLDYISDELAIILRPELKEIWGIAA